MPLDLGQRFAFDWLGHPPHMSSQDLPLWERFQEKYGSQFIGFHFDAALGTPAEIPAGTEEKLAKMWTRLTSKRIDAVGVKSNEYWLIEVRPQAAAGALGTILTYRAAWLKDPPDGKPFRSVIVSDIFDPDIIENAKNFGIELIAV
ncbi:MAG: hypothetical protein AAB587_01955 [Patescibacteria group bacterium]